MIRARRTDDATVLTLDGEHRLALLDSDWIVIGEEVPALLVDAGGSVWWDGELLESDQHDPRRFAEALLGRQAEAIVAAVEHVDPQRVWVIGGGLVASEVRRLLGQPSTARAGERPLAAVDLTGVELERACQAVVDGGTVIVAGARQRCDIDLYAHVHRRGLTVVGIPDIRSLAEASPNSPPGTGAPLPEPATAAPGESLPPALWYRLVSP
jgi:hypothetical protein